MTQEHATTNSSAKLPLDAMITQGKVRKAVQDAAWDLHQLQHQATGPRSPGRTRGQAEWLRQVHDIGLNANTLEAVAS